MKCGVGTLIELIEATTEMQRNILCKYKIKQKFDIENIDPSENEEEIKKAV